MKKTIALVLAAMMLMTLLLSGCGDSTESSKVSTRRHHWGHCECGSQ